MKCTFGCRFREAFRKDILAMHTVINCCNYVIARNSSNKKWKHMVTMTYFAPCRQVDLARSLFLFSLFDYRNTSHYSTPLYLVKTSERNLSNRRWRKSLGHVFNMYSRWTTTIESRYSYFHRRKRLQARNRTSIPSLIRII